MLEKKFQLLVKKYIESKGGYVINYNPLATGTGGAPDLLCSIKGVFVGIELKTNHLLQQRQALNLKFINNSGGVGMVIKNNEDWKTRISNLFIVNSVDKMREQSHVDIDKFLKKVEWDD